MYAVGLRVPCGAVAVVFFALAEVDSTREFADDCEVYAADVGGFEGGTVDEAVRGEEAGAQVAECAELFAEFQDALFGADFSCTPFLFGR
jgi:hypothetical protein